MKATVHVTLKDGVLDPAGKATEQALHHLGFEEAEGVRIGRYIELDVDAPDAASAEQRVQAMCEKLLANTVVERYRVDVKEA